MAAFKFYFQSGGKKRSVGGNGNQVAFGKKFHGGGAVS
jgi:hypothetical protein